MNSPAKIPASSWLLIICGSLLLLLSFGYRSSYGLFVQPISEANQWGRDVIALALAIQNLAWGIIAAFAGGFADRFGTVRVLIIGTLIYASGIWFTAEVDSTLMLNSSVGLLIGAGIAGTSFGIVLPVMARAVAPERRQWVLGIGTAAGSMGQFVLPPIAQAMIGDLGWISALHILSLSSLLMILLALPLGRITSDAVHSEQQAHLDHTLMETLHRAFKHRSYQLLTFGFFVCGFHVAFITAHMPAFLVDAGFSSEVGAWSIALIGLCNVIGAFAAGIISSHKPKRLVLIVIYSGRAIAITLFMVMPLTLTSVIIFSCAMGFLWLATVPPTSGLVAVMFGTRYMATLYGIVFMSHQIGSFTGVWLGGWLYENFGSYDLLWWSGVALSFVAVMLHTPIQEQRSIALQRA